MKKLSLSAKKVRRKYLGYIKPLKYFLSMKFEKHSLITIVGMVWFIVGLALLFSGLEMIFLIDFLQGQTFTPLINILMYAFTGAIIPSIIVICLVGLLLGYVKSKWALVRMIGKTMERIYPLSGLVRISNLYRLHEALLVIAVITLSRVIKIFPIPLDVQGVINIAIGSALINGAVIYFRFALRIEEDVKNKTKAKS